VLLFLGQYPLHFLDLVLLVFFDPRGVQALNRAQPRSSSTGPVLPAVGQPTRMTSWGAPAGYGCDLLAMRDWGAVQLAEGHAAPRRRAPSPRVVSVDLNGLILSARLRR
jgi:hypothetical protein